jgi:hypothetical protein
LIDARIVMKDDQVAPQGMVSVSVIGDKRAGGKRHGGKIQQ